MRRLAILAALAAALLSACAPTVETLEPPALGHNEMSGGVAQVPVRFAFAAAPGTTLVPSSFKATLSGLRVTAQGTRDVTASFTVSGNEAAGALAISEPGLFKVSGSIKDNLGQTGRSTVEFAVDTKAATFVGGPNLFSVYNLDALCPGLPPIVDVAPPSFPIYVIDVPGFAEVRAGPSPYPFDLGFLGVRQPIQLVLNGTGYDLPDQPVDVDYAFPGGGRCRMSGQGSGVVVRTSDATADVLESVLVESATLSGPPIPNDTVGGIICNAAPLLQGCTIVGRLAGAAYP